MFIGTFHMRMNKTIQDIENGMPTEVNREDELSLGYYRTILNMTQITNIANNIKKDFEKHDQFILAVGEEIIVHTFNHFLQSNKQHYEQTKEGASRMILSFLEQMDFKYYYDPQNFDEKEPYDDALSACRSYASRTIMSLVADAVVHQCDGLGCRAVRTAMIPYFLNKK